MKKLIALCILFFTAFIVKAQTADETLEWLRAKQSAISQSVGDLKIDETSIKVSNEEKITNILWSKIKDIRLKFRDITIVSDELVNGKSTFIVLMIDPEIASKYAKALRHLATLKGAKMVKDDMF